MVQQTPAEIINDAEISLYLSVNDVLKGALFPSPLNKTSPEVIYTEYKSVQWRYNQNPPVTAVNALGSILITGTGNNGNNIIAKVLDPILGLITLGSYSKVSGDTDTTILATNVAAALNINTYGYAVSNIANAVNITGRNGLGASLNGNNLSVTATVLPEVKAKAFFTPTRVSTGTVFNVTVVDPNLGSVQVGTYTQQVTDTSDTIFIANLVASINVDGYTGITSGSNGMYVVAAAGLGNLINGNLSQIVWMGGFNSANFSGGVNGYGLIPNTLIQFSGGVTGIAPTQDLIATSNYLYWLCGAYNLQAINIRTNGGGGSVAPIVPPTRNVNTIEFIVSDSSPIPNGGNTLILDGTNGNQDFRGLNIFFNRNNIPQGTINLGDSYYSWNKVNGQFICFPDAVTSENFQIIPTV